jgi:deazaflavin-dependent oxidoreductase (nitroreductase family)
MPKISSGFVQPEVLETLLKEKLAHLTTVGRKTGKPHRVELWFALGAGRIFLSHEGDYTDWMRNITKNRRVRIQIGTLNVEADATILNEGAPKELGKTSLYEKYYGPAPKATVDDWFELSTIIELTPVASSSLNSS